MKKVSLEDISKELGVSKSLVSFVMNGRAKEMRVSDSMAEKILLKAKEMGYKPNYLARALRTGKSYTLGLIVADIANPFFSKLARSIENEAIKFNYNVIFGSSDENGSKSKKLVDVFLDKKVDGLIICPSSDGKNLVKGLKKSKIPFVLLDRYFDDVESNIVIVNNKEASFQIVQRQINKGCKRIGHIGFKHDLINAQLRLEGYMEALKKNSLNYDKKIVKQMPFEGIENETQEAVKELLELAEPLDSIYFGNNHLALLGVKYIKEYNKNNKKHISVCSFDGLDLMELLEVPMIYGVQPIEKLGKLSVELMMEQIESEKELNKKLVIPIEIKELED